jgi:hypothetical protein
VDHHVDALHGCDDRAAVDEVDPADVVSGEKGDRGHVALRTRADPIRKFATSLEVRYEPANIAVGLCITRTTLGTRYAEWAEHGAESRVAPTQWSRTGTAPTPTRR